MPDAVIAAERTVACSPDRAFALFGTTGDAGWLFGARCDSVEQGAAVSIQLPLDDHDGRRSVDLLGRFARVVPGSLIEVEHAQPWRGRLTVRFTGIGTGGTRIRVRAGVPPEGIGWLLHRRGIPLPAPPEDGAVRIGVITTASGPGAVFSMSAELMAELAVDEVNADGGIAGRPLRLMVADDATDSTQAAREAERLVRLGCRAIFVNATSASFEAARRAVAGRGVLLVHTVINEGGNDSPAVLRLGERPRAQLDALVPHTMREAGARRWFFVGQSYVWSYGAHIEAHRVVGQAGGHLAGEEFTPLGTTDFTSTLDRIRDSKADLVLSSLVGADEVAFERQSEAAGLREVARTVALVLDESTLAHVGPRAGTGLRTALSYFQDGPLPGNPELLERYRTAYGRWAPPVSALSETVYEAIHQYAQILHQDPDASAAEHGRALSTRHRRDRVDTVGRRRLVMPPVFVAEVDDQGLRITEASAPRS